MLQVRREHDVVVAYGGRGAVGLVALVVFPDLLQGPDVGPDLPHGLLDRVHPFGPRPVPPPQIPGRDADHGVDERPVPRIPVAFTVRILAHPSRRRLPFSRDPSVVQEPRRARSDRRARGVGATRTRRLRAPARRARRGCGRATASRDRSHLRDHPARAVARRQGRVPLRDVQPQRRVPGGVRHIRRCCASSNRSWAKTVT